MILLVQWWTAAFSLVDSPLQIVTYIKYDIHDSWKKNCPDLFKIG